MHPLTSQSRVNVLQLVVQRPVSYKPDWAFVAVLIDGVDLMGGLQHLWRGFDPSTFLVRPSPVSPPARPRRVVIGVCGCLSVYCDALAPLVSADTAHVRWSDFRSYSGVFEDPFEDRIVGDEPRGGRRMDIDAALFDRKQYEDELDRAATDRSWESSA